MLASCKCLVCVPSSVKSVQGLTLPFCPHHNSGYEIFIPTEHAMQVYDQIWEVGEGMGLQSAGLRALGSLRMVRNFQFSVLHAALG